MASKEERDVAGVTAVLARRADALRGRSAGGTLGTQSSDFVQYGLAGPLQLSGSTGMTAAYLEQTFAAFDGPVDYEVVDQHVLVGDDVAVTYGLSRISYSIAGERTDVWFRKTLALARVDGSWVIVHEHESVPVAADGRAATELLP